jgi:hypothetical protein
MIVFEISDFDFAILALLSDNLNKPIHPHLKGILSTEFQHLQLIFTNPIDYLGSSPTSVRIQFVKVRLCSILGCMKYERDPPCVLRPSGGKQCHVFQVRVPANDQSVIMIVHNLRCFGFRGNDSCLRSQSIQLALTSAHAVREVNRTDFGPGILRDFRRFRDGVRLM